MLLPMSSAMFKRVFPKEVRGTFFHVTDVDGFENLYDIQNSKRSISCICKYVTNHYEDWCCKW